MPTLYMVTMPHNPACERARWALDAWGEPYTEERFPPLQHRKALKKIHAGHTVPGLLVSNREVFKNSDEILNYVDDQLSETGKLFPTDKADGPWVHDFCLRCERELSPLVYPIVLYGCTYNEFFRWCTEGCPPELISKYRMSSPFVFFMTKRNFKVNKEGFEEAIFSLNKFFMVAEQLFGDGRKFLFAGRFTAADLTFCSYVGAILMLPEYGGSNIDLAKANPRVEAEVKRLRNSNVGRYVQAIYKRFRKTIL
jgi:glutathione S-transferase